MAMEDVAERVSRVLSRGVEQAKALHASLHVVQYGALARKHAVALVGGACVLTVLIITVGLTQSSSGEHGISKRGIISNPTNTTKAGGAVYTRWGRTECPAGAGTKLVYTGYTTGSHYTHAGSGANHLCLPKEPEWDQKDDAVKNRGLIYGAEYELPAGSFPFDPRHATDGANLNNHNVPCAVCHSARPTVLMIPALTTCPAGWVLEYSGYIMSSHYTQKRSEYICVDRAPEADDAGYRDENGALLYSVEATCGSLPCPPYVGGWELACVVCTHCG